MALCKNAPVHGQKKLLGTPTVKLAAYKADLLDMNKRLIFCAGLPSSGKTFQAIDAAVHEVENHFYDQLILIRPVVNPEFGYLPGGIMEKMHPYIAQSSKYCAELNGQTTLEDMIDSGRAEVWSSGLLQGNRFRRAYIIVDEAQNIHVESTFAILSRVGEGSKFVIIGDISRGQRNIKFPPEKSLLYYCMDKFQGKSYAGIHEFYDEDDILGDAVTKDIIVTLMDDFV